MDFSKAFHSINHNILSEKLELSWHIKSIVLDYLRGRSHQVSIGDFKSKAFFSDRGVPQESSFGSPLFATYINDISNFIDSNILIYADDLKIYLAIESAYDVSKLQSDLDRILDWCSNNKLNFNFNKCHVLSFCRSRSPVLNDYSLGEHRLKRVFSTCDLGVTFS